MPVYVHYCDACAVQLEDVRPMSAAARLPNCPQCGNPARRDFAAESKHRGYEFRPYDSVAFGAPPGALRRAKRDAHGNWLRRDARTGQMRQINPPGVLINPNGTVRVESAAQKRNLLRLTGMTDYGPPSDSELRRVRRGE